MKACNAKKYGFLMCLSMTIGTIIGTGIFFKNEGVYGFTNGNGILGIIAWIIGGIMSISFGLSFMEIASSKQDCNSGIALYARIFGCSKFGKVVRNSMNHIYIPLTTFTVSYYTIKATIWAVGGGQSAEDIFAAKLGGNTNYIILIVLFSMFYAILIAYLAIFYENVGKNIQMITTILKIFPLLIIGIVGLFIVNDDAGFLKETGLGDQSKYKIVENKSHFSMILMALPGILFAFDGFLSTTYIQKDVKNAEKNVPLALILGLTAVTFIYILTSIGTLNLDSSGSVAEAAGKIFKNQIMNSTFKRLIFIFIAISALGTLNGYTFSLTKMTKDSISDQFLLGSSLWNKLNKKLSSKMVNLIASLTLIFVWMVIMVIPTLIDPKKYNFIEFISNGGVIMAFLIYGSIIFMGLLNRYSKKVKTKKQWYFIPSAIISIILIALVIGYNIYSYFEVVINEEQKIAPILQIILLILLIILPWISWIIPEKKKQKNIETE